MEKNNLLAENSIYYHGFEDIVTHVNPGNAKGEIQGAQWGGESDMLLRLLQPTYLQQQDRGQNAYIALPHYGISFRNDGGNRGFLSTYRGSFDGNGVVIMVNSDNYHILEEIVNSVASVYHWKDYQEKERN